MPDAFLALRQLDPVALRRDSAEARRLSQPEQD